MSATGPTPRVFVNIRAAAAVILRRCSAGACPARRGKGRESDWRVRSATAAPCRTAVLRPLLRVLLLAPLLPLHVRKNNACTSGAMGAWQAAVSAHDSMFSTSKVRTPTSVLPPRLARCADCCAACTCRHQRARESCLGVPSQPVLASDATGCGQAGCHGAACSHSGHYLAQQCTSTLLRGRSVVQQPHCVPLGLRQVAQLL
jgi:hypothetical protein